MWHLIPSQVCPFFHTTAYPVAPSSIRDPSVNIVSPGRALYLCLFLGFLLLQHFYVEGLRLL